jgi:nucleoid-associated protein YgaU
MPLGDVARYYKQQKQQRQVTSGMAVQKRKEISSPAQQPKFIPAPVVEKTKHFLASTTPSTKAAPNAAPKATLAAPKATLPGSSAGSSVTVNEGDSLWKIASRYLGDGNQWPLIASANPQIADPNRIHAGEQIALPATVAEVALSSHQVRVQSGDSLWKLAKAEWGTGLAWNCISAANPQVNATGRIYPGQILTLPESCSSI